MTISGVVLVLFVIVAVLMTFLILLQEGKGGGLAALGGTKAAGVEGVTNPIRRATGYLAAIFFVLAITLAAIHRPDKPGFKGESASADEKKADSATMGSKPADFPKGPAVNVPPAPAPAPEKVNVEKKPEPAKGEEPKKEEPAKEVKPEEKKADAAAPAPAPEKKDEAKAAAPAPEKKEEPKAAPAEEKKDAAK